MRVVSGGIGVVLWGACLTVCWADGAEGWRTYEVYAPRIERYFVLNGVTNEINYNHCASIAWFRDRWFCVWNGNRLPWEGAPDQPIYLSTSRDGKVWSPAQPVFCSEQLSENPVPTQKGRQWQPNLAVVNDELWCFWSQSGGPKEHLGCYFSKLTDLDSKWVNRRLLWDGDFRPVIDGKPFRIFPTQNPYRLRSGRVLAPVSLIGPRAEDVPKSIEDWWSNEKRNSVIYTDDAGKTWHVSPGCIQPRASWANWEPTVWEQSDGTVLMFARNNLCKGLGHGSVKSSEFLLRSISRDGGATWTPHEYVPIETVCSRMHVVPLDGRGVWRPAIPSDDFTGRFYLMVHNDAPGGKLSWSDARRNLSLYFKRGDGIEFIAGLGLTGFEHVVCYPQMWIRSDSLLVCYSEESDPHRSIKVAHVTPLPDPANHYLLPRSNVAAPSPVPEREGATYLFDHDQRIATRAVVKTAEHGFGLGAWVRPERAGTILDTRGPKGGVLFMIRPNRDPSGHHQPLCALSACLPKDTHVIDSKMTVQSGRWQYVGVTVDTQKKQAVFYVDDKSQTVPLKALPRRPLTADTGHIGAKRFEQSSVPGFVGAIRAVALYPSVEFGQGQHAWLHNAFATELDRPALPGAIKPIVEPSLWFDPADEEGFKRDFVLPPDTRRRGPQVVTVDGRPAVRFEDEGSAGVDLDENHRNRGDKVELRFRFRIERGDGQTLCTVGDANERARLIARSGQLVLRAGEQQAPLGNMASEGWTSVEVETWGNLTNARISGRPFGEVRHHPLGTWVYLGEGYPTYGPPTDRSFIVDVSSVRTRVSRTGQ